MTVGSSQLTVDTITNGIESVSLVNAISGFSIAQSKYSMDENYQTNIIIESFNISSVTDQGTGNPEFNITIALATADGASRNGPGKNNAGSELPKQHGSKINSTTAIELYCGSNTSSKADWDLGYWTLYGDLA